MHAPAGGFFSYLKNSWDLWDKVENIESVASSETLTTGTIETQNAEPVMIDMHIQNYYSTDPIRGNTSQINVGKPMDTSVVASDSVMINALNKQNYRAKMQEARRKNIIYKQNH